MKIRTIAMLAAMASASSFCAIAETQEFKFKAVDQNLETQVCLKAATEGLASAKQLVSENDINFSFFNKTVTCNGESLKSFANLYYKSAVDVNEPKVVAVRAKNANVESQLCLDALIIGEEQARQKHDLQGVEVTCNDKPLSIFVRKFERQNLTVKLAD
ncbi:DUF3718 domain-containing protein [Glaciecola petra]|uniref:DUF3718 domain-containing protein n=1 Tax=Glaciecola petra TaxID=3075602 RepID=A0ABU2ZMX5_9ALTE|nr:DUF3718 domain-containing protein [Aestuariibacter sp. P117]MDT0593393.1 DUF3718 domain-containing protein [Aestuariibacter sp. P117]